MTLTQSFIHRSLYFLRFTSVQLSVHIGFFLTNQILLVFLLKCQELYDTQPLNVLQVFNDIRGSALVSLSAAFFRSHILLKASLKCGGAIPGPVLFSMYFFFPLGLIIGKH